MNEMKGTIISGKISIYMILIFITLFGGIILMFAEAVNFVIQFFGILLIILGILGIRYYLRHDNGD